MTKEIQKAVNNGSETDGTRSVRVLRPAVDIQELADSYVVRLDTPGADKESIAAKVNQAILTVSARVHEYFKRDAELLYDNSLPTEYRREFTLADNVDTQTVEALYELGVLKVTLQKKRQFLPREIKIG
jgi:HSP20 family protein